MVLEDEGVSDVVGGGGGNDDDKVDDGDEDDASPTTSPFSLSFQFCPLVTFCCCRRLRSRIYKKRLMIEPATTVMAIAIRTHCQTNSVAMYIHRFWMLYIYNVKEKGKKGRMKNKVQQWCGSFYKIAFYMVAYKSRWMICTYTPLLTHSHVLSIITHAAMCACGFSRLACSCCFCRELVTKSGSQAVYRDPKYKWPQNGYLFTVAGSPDALKAGKEN